MKKRERTLYERLTRPMILLWSGAVLMILLVLGLFKNFTLIPALENLSIDILQTEASSISWFLNMQTSQLYQLGDMLDVKDGKENCLKELGIANQVKNSYETIGIVGRNGMNYLTTGESFSISGEDYYKEIIRSEKDTIFSKPVDLKGDGKKMIMILAKLRKNDEMMEYISASVPLSSLRSVLERSNSFDFCMKIVKDEGNTVLLQVGQKSIEGQLQDASKARIYRRAIKGWDGISVEMEVPNSFLYAQLNNLMKGVTIVAILLLIITSVLTKKITTKTIKPIRYLSQAMSDNHLSELSVSQSDTNIKEIAQLTESYNSMLQNTKQLIRVLEEEEMRKKDAEYEALIQQIKPHFLYNTLEMIQSMCIGYEDDRVENAIGLLADFFRSSLNGGKMLIPLKKELHQVESYLKLQQLRYEDQFTYEIQDDTDGNDLFMRFTLQPIVENAIYHGVKTSSRKEKIRIHCVKEEKNLKIMVENTCERCDVAKIREINRLFEENADAERYPGYGLYNVNCRLKLHYGRGSALKMDRTEDGVCVTILHPLISAQEEETHEDIDCR